MHNKESQAMLQKNKTARRKIACHGFGRKPSTNFVVQSFARRQCGWGVEALVAD